MVMTMRTNLHVSEINGQTAMVYYKGNGFVFKIDTVEINQAPITLDYKTLARVKSECITDYFETISKYEMIEARHRG